MGSVDSGMFNVKRVAIIGAGPCGLAAAKYLVAQQAFESVVIYEQNPDVGGVWLYSPTPTSTLHVPQTSPFCAPDPPIIPSSPSSPPIVPSPMYETLHTNIPWPLMKYSDLDFPTDSLIFPTRAAVHDYLVEYARDVRHLIRFSTQVQSVKRRCENGHDRWDITTSPTTATTATTTATFDAVVVASGHYATQYIPDVPGIRAFHAAHPTIISHAKSFRRPQAFASKRKVLVVGNSASGLDIAAQIRRHLFPRDGNSKLYLSVHEPTTPPENLALAAPDEELPAIEAFLPAQRGVRLVDGRVVEDLDAVVYATGYLFAFPFFDPDELSLKLISEDGRKVRGLYKHLFSRDHPTLVFPGLPIKVIPFPMAEAQAAVVARVWANAVALPGREEMERWEREEERERREESGSRASFHVFPKGGDARYLDEFHAWAMQAGDGCGKEPPVWTAEQRWQRANYVEAKLKFEQSDKTARSLEELGLVFEPIE